MPITTNREIIPFVNKLERELRGVEEAISSWEKEKAKIYAGIEIGKDANRTAIAALAKVDEALGEITGATFGIQASRGSRLKTAIENMKKEILDIVEHTPSGGGGGNSGGGELTEGEFFEELNNAISNVDSSVHPGLKLDYLLNELKDTAEEAMNIRYKRFSLLTKYETTYLEGESIIIPEEEGTEIKNGFALLLDEDLQIVTNEFGGELLLQMVRVGKSGRVSFSQKPALEDGDKINLYYFLSQEFEDTPEDFIKTLLDIVIQKGEAVQSDITEVDAKINLLLKDIDLMKGKYWTPDFSIMKNHIDLSKEMLTPKGVHLREDGDAMIVSFSYTDHESLSHFEMEAYNEEEEVWEPINNGNNGIISK